ncbi:uncharacterized protein L969DRAFT_87215 [Mixia osmundae IAM 14324]|uniref:Riboflavin synthase n=1 Tax=Mixia osmundae (strain CBS 9802 / IAM 14324 / JCM 22182 / KY 12970) TaxID=764103 RepID=G7DZQ8_MIXOS|nr:uncharacterized protein L969DRAFT_87215 [Mixia osmundae IAM 14324]KEI39273.1 hypothetical protein L969DRAFT_87215 [Mixia osmundae IAM 14324]GAA96068.1 hypothetical protein E5Q_02729 [Mixia osmundae IAM 14324]
MFTGLVEHLGTVTSIKEQDTTSSGGGGWSVTIGQAKPILSDCSIGDSICINGACLTVTEFDEDSFKVGLAPETLARTDLGDLKVGSKVNLERAMATGARYGGHFVQGHVDSTARIVSRQPDGNSIRLIFELPESAEHYMEAIIEKGYIALDGTSLTITEVDDTQRRFGVMLIAHTQDKVVLTDKKEGDKINVEIDVVCKNVEKIVKSALQGSGQAGGAIEALVEKVVERTLRKHQLI